MRQIKISRVILSQSAAVTDYNVNRDIRKSLSRAMLRIASAPIRQIFDTSHLPTALQ